MALLHTLIMSSMHKILISYPKVGILSPLSPLSPLSLPPHPHPASRIPPPHSHRIIMQKAWWHLHNSMFMHMQVYVDLCRFM